MCLEPILLEAPLTTVFGWLALALGTGVEWYVLLFYFLDGILSALHLFLNDLLEWTHIVLAVGDVD